MQRVFYAKLGVDTPTLLVARGLSSIHVPLYITALIHYPMLRRTETRSSFGVSLMRECAGLGSIPLACLMDRQPTIWLTASKGNWPTYELRPLHSFSTFRPTPGNIVSPSSRSMWCLR